MPGTGGVVVPSSSWKLNRLVMPLPLIFMLFFLTGTFI